MEPTAQALLTLGGLLLVGLVADEMGRRVGVPRVTLLLLLGFAVGPGGFDLLPETTEDWFPLVSTLALTMVGFVLGAEFTAERLREHGRDDVTVALIQAVATAVVVGGGLLAVGVESAVALSLAGIAVATAPAATLAVVRDRRADGPFTRTLLVVTALDDVIALVVFGLLVTAATLVAGEDGLGVVGDAAWEIVGAVGLGLILGLPVAYLTGRLRPGEPTQEEAYAAVLICAGLALWLDVSFLLAAVVMGATIANLARHHEVPFHEIERIEWPALVVFFVLAGASLDLEALGDVGLLGLGYVLLRVVGKVFGCVAGGRAVGMPRRTRWWLGGAMLPQAGVAIGLTLLAADRFPDVADDIVPVVIAATVVFELVGPVVTATALDRLGESASSESG